MTIGPEPITRMRCRSVRRGMQAESSMMSACVLRGAHPVSRINFAGEPTSTGMSVGANERRLGRNVGGHASAKQDVRGKLAHADADPAATLYTSPDRPRSASARYASATSLDVQEVADDVVADRERRAGSPRSSACTRRHERRQQILAGRARHPSD